MIPANDLQVLIGMSHAELYALSAQYARPFFQRVPELGIQQKWAQNIELFIYTCIYIVRPLHQFTPDSLMMALILKCREGFSDKVMGFLSNYTPQGIGSLLNKFRLVL